MRSGPNVRDYFIAATESADLHARLKAAWTTQIVKNCKAPSRFVEPTSSSQTQPYTPPSSSYDRSKHERVWQALGEWSDETLLTEEQFYFAFGQELNTVYERRVIEWVPKDEDASNVLKMRRWARAAIALKIVQARISGNLDEEVTPLRK